MASDPIQRIALVGLPAVGKSTIGRRLAVALGRSFFDTDDLVQKMTGRSVAGVFDQDGEARFRELEADALAGIGERQEAAVIATGGGIVTTGRCRDFLTNRTFAIYLRLSSGRLVGRLSKSDRRPLFRSGDVASTLAGLHAARDPHYLAVARLVVDIDGNATNEVVAHIVEALSREPKGGHRPQ